MTLHESACDYVHIVNLLLFPSDIVDDFKSFRASFFNKKVGDHGVLHWVLWEATHNKCEFIFFK